MLRVTALLVVAMFAGAPAGVLVCEVWCGQVKTAHHQPQAGGCHAASAGHGVTRLSGVVACHDDVAVAPFLTEARQSAPEVPSQPSAMASSSRLTSVVEPEFAARWKPFREKPPREPALHAVLLI